MSTTVHPPTAHVGSRPRVTPGTGFGRWLTVAAAVLVVAVLGLGAWIIYDAYWAPESEATQLLDDSLAALSTFDKAALSEVYTDSVVFHWADGTTTVGLDALTEEIAALQGFGFSVERASDVTQEGDFASAFVRFESTAAEGTELALYQVAGGKIAEVWAYQVPTTATG